jgi:RNA polymerase sigma-70 factor, ECF subfamily
MLANLFLSYLSEASRDQLPGAVDLEAWLLESVTNAQTAFPEIHQTPEEFTRYLAAAVAALPTPSSFRKLLTTDLYLACACGRLDSHALAIFEQRYLPPAQRALARLDAPRSVTDDLVAGLREKLFFGAPGARPLITEYGGRGGLGAWVRSVVVHAALNAMRKEDKTTALEEAPDLVDPGDPELAYLKSTYGVEFKTALGEGMSLLSDRERNVLRQRYLDGLNIDALGRLYGVHRATVARWITEACDALLSNVRVNLARRLALTESELDSVIRMGRSGLDVTLSRLLRNE